MFTKGKKSVWACWISIRTPLLFIIIVRSNGEVHFKPVPFFFLFFLVSIRILKKSKNVQRTRTTIIHFVDIWMIFFVFVRIICKCSFDPIGRNERVRCKNVHYTHTHTQCCAFKPKLLCLLILENFRICLFSF